jgi:hypothetical protein
MGQLMNSNLKIVFEPTGLELVNEISPPGFRDWMIQFMGGRIDNFPQAFIDAVNNPEAELAPLLSEMLLGDRLWRCRSEERGPLYGHEGVAVVRDGRPVVYMRAINY